jgi:hemoglobin
VARRTKNETLLRRYAQIFRKLVLVTQSAVVSHFFDNTDMEKQRRYQTAFGVADLGYEGLNMPAIETSIHKASGFSSYFFHTLIKQRPAFISYALGGPKPYSGSSIEKAHAGLNLQPEHFDAIVKHLTDAIIAHGASQEDLDEALGKIATLKEAVLYK